jgi:intracellular septation protein
MSDRAGEERGLRRLYATALELGPLLLFFVANGKGASIGTAFIVARRRWRWLYRWMVSAGRSCRWSAASSCCVRRADHLDRRNLHQASRPSHPAGVILGGGLLFFRRPLLKPIFGSAFRLTDEGWRKLTLRWALFFFVLAAINEVMWRGFPTDTWIASKMFLSFPLTLVFAFLQVPLLKRHWDGEDNPFAKAD